MGGHAPSLAANALDNWPVQFRRPSVIRLFGHAWEWSGYLNYTKAIPAYQGDLSPQNKFTSYFTNVNGGRVYATGFNEEGYQVTPRGLEDITTGNTLTVDNLGSNDLALETPTAFNNLTLNGTTTINDTLVINATNAAFPDVLGATVDKAGVGEIASISELETTSLAATDGGLTAAGNKFVTVAGLKYWASYARRSAAKRQCAWIWQSPTATPTSAPWRLSATSWPTVRTPAAPPSTRSPTWSVRSTSSPKRISSLISTAPEFARPRM